MFTFVRIFLSIENRVLNKAQKCYIFLCVHILSVAPERIRKWGYRRIFVVVTLHFFGSTSTISRFGKSLRDVQYSLVNLLFAVLLLTVPLSRPYSRRCLLLLFNLSLFYLFELSRYFVR